jgi:hypothetical protein
VSPHTAIDLVQGLGGLLKSKIRIFEGIRKGCLFTKQYYQPIISHLWPVTLLRRSDVNKPYRRILISKSIKHSFCDNIYNVA